MPENKQKNQNLTKENNHDILTIFQKGGKQFYEKTRKSILVNYENYSHKHDPNSHIRNRSYGSKYQIK